MGVQLFQQARDGRPDVVHVDLVAPEDHHLHGGVWDDDRGMALLKIGGRGEYPLCLQQTVERGELTVRGEGSQLSCDSGKGKRR